MNISPSLSASPLNAARQVQQEILGRTPAPGAGRADLLKVSVNAYDEAGAVNDDLELSGGQFADLDDMFATAYASPAPPMPAELKEA